MDRFGQRSLDEAMASIAVPGTDPEAVSEYVVGRLAARVRRSRFLFAFAAVLALLAGGTAFALSGGDNPDEVVAPAADSEADPNSDADADPSDAGSGTVVTAVPTTIPTTATLPGTSAPSIAGLRSGVAGGPRLGPGAAPSLSPPSSPGPALPAAPGTTASTLPPDSPLTAGAIEVNAMPVGSLVEVALDWNDPDLPEGNIVSGRVGTDSGAFTSGALAAADGACTGGSGASGRISGVLRFAAAGRHTVTVEISACAGPPKTFSTEVDIAPASCNDIPAISCESYPSVRTVRVVAQPGVNPESGEWFFTPTEGADAGVRQALRNDVAGDSIPDNDPSLAQDLGSPATVLVVPDVAGTIGHVVGGTTYVCDVADNPATCVAD